MTLLKLSDSAVVRVEEIYMELERAYRRVARMLSFNCEGCSDNCCDSYFQHHTYLEWCYLWHGLEQLSEQQRQELEQRACQYMKTVEASLQRQERPQVMCPLNRDGLCMAYKHRLLVCRTHGVPASIRRPDGQTINFPGCFRCQELVKDEENPPRVERTPLLSKLAFLENELLNNKRHLYPKVNLTIAEMIIKGPPELPLLQEKQDREL